MALASDGRPTQPSTSENFSSGETKFIKEAGNLRPILGAGKFFAPPPPPPPGGRVPARLGNGLVCTCTGSRTPGEAPRPPLRAGLVCTTKRLA